MMSDGHTARAELAALLKDLDDATAERNAAIARVSTISAVVSGRVVLAAGESIGLRAAVTLARRLYWDYPQVSVESVATLLGVAESRVARAVGPVSVERRCRACGLSFTWSMPSRHALAPSMCPDCHGEAATEVDQMAGWPKSPQL